MGWSQKGRRFSWSVTHTQAAAKNMQVGGSLSQVTQVHLPQSLSLLRTPPAPNFPLETFSNSSTHTRPPTTTPSTLPSPHVGPVHVGAKSRARPVLALELYDHGLGDPFTPQLVYDA